MTADRRIPSKTELLEALRSSEQEALSKLRALSPEVFEQGRYENGWDARQILAHIASIEWSYPRLLDLARQAQTPAPNADAADGKAAESTSDARPRPATGEARGGIDGYNQRQVDRRAGASVQELLAELRKNRSATISAVEAADDALLSTPIRSAGGVSGALAEVIYSVAIQHMRAHVRDIAGPS